MAELVVCAMGSPASLLFCYSSCSAGYRPRSLALPQLMLRESRVLERSRGRSKLRSKSARGERGEAGRGPVGIECRGLPGSMRNAGRVRAASEDAVDVDGGGSTAQSSKAGVVRDTGGAELSSQEFFESFLRSRQASGDFVSKAADALRRKEEVDELDEESRQSVRDKLAQLQKEREVDDSGNFLKLSQARNWSLGQDDARPTNPNSAALDRERAREDRRQQSLFEYEALKRELSLMTVGIAVAASAYCLVILSPETAFSYSIGALASLGYLQLLYRHADEVSEDNVAEIFVQRRRQRRIGITSTDLQESFEKFFRGSSRALSSPRLVVPAALFGLWAVTDHLAESSPIHLELAPLLVGFFAYKAAALVQAYRDNKDLLFVLPEPKGPEDA